MCGMKLSSPICLLTMDFLADEWSHKVIFPLTFPPFFLTRLNPIIIHMQVGHQRTRIKLCNMIKV